MEELRNKVIEMQNYCKENDYCISKGGVVCPYREACIKYLKSGCEVRVPASERIEKMVKYLYNSKRDRRKKTRQKFYNSQIEHHISTHPAGSYWRRLQYTYCKRRGFVIKEDWLDFQNFAEWYDIQSCDGAYSPVLEQKKGVIDETTIKWVKNV